MASETAQTVYKAKLAEQAERYDEVCVWGESLLSPTF